MKKKLIFALWNTILKENKNNIIINHPGGDLIKRNFNNEYFYSERWSHQKNLINDNVYLHKLYEKILTYLSKFLNTYHKVNFTKKYWRIVIGIWLYKFICVVFERWNALKEVSLQYKEIDTEILRYNSEKFIPYGNEDFSYFIQTDSWNTYIFYELINNLKFNSIIKKSSNKILLLNDVNEIYKRLTLRNTNYKNKIFNYLQKFFLKNNQNLDHFIFDTYLSNLEEIKINLRLNKKLMLFKSLKFDDLYPNLLVEKKKLSNERTEKNKIKKNNFDNFIFEFCKKNIPKTYLEYFDLTNKVLKKYKLPKKPKSIFTTLGICRSTLMDIYIANKIEGGTKLIIAQHGGNYGQHKVHFGTSHEHKIAQKFFSWGFKFRSNTKPLGIIKKIHNKKYNKKNDLILLEFRTRSLYSQTLKMDSGAINSKIYMQNLIEFYKNLKNEEILDQLKVKLHNKDYGVQEKKILLEANKKINFIDPKKNSASLYKKTKLVIHTFPSSGHLECMTSNIPMLIFFVNDINLLKPETKKYFKKFKKLGIYHDNPISLGNMVRKIYKDPGKWWYSKRIQYIRKKYTEGFAISNKNLVNDIIQTLKKV